MNDKRRLFVAEYLVDRNGRAAAIRAGYSEHSAGAIADELLNVPEVAAAVEASLTAQVKRLEATADDVVQEMVRMAMFDPAVFKDVKSVEDIANLPEDARRAIVGWSFDRKGRLVLKLAKEKAIEMLGRHHGLFNDRIEVKGVIGLAGRMRKMGEGA